METLLFTLGVIVNNRGEERLRIAHAEARELVGSIQTSGVDARPRISACLERLEACKAADDIAAAG
ncbi:hypothetical protein WGT02_36910 (plasmid) [Rhizobium sp. T1470]|uniref:hypothetical protein n=1 Tax=unclassified Rhizobium TaxID=2613769 RepID=UPI001AAECC13|nr:hypothetical protein [Rhizobium sp. T1473]MCA0807025.1 hypothetical protein [Rhizobium sp. T1473]